MRALPITSSISGKRWELRPADDRAALTLIQRYALPELAGRVLAARGVGDEEVELFLNPSLRQQLPDPSCLKDLDLAVDRLMQAIHAGEDIGIFGDYDVDGATSTAILVRFLRAVGREAIPYIPDRQKEGYGPNLPAMKKLRAQGVKVLLTVDCGITAFEALEGAAEAGLDVIVVDHHVAEPRLPRAVAVLNPNRLDDDSPCGALAAVGVVFLLVVALNRALRAAGYYQDKSEPDLRLLLDLVALGTVCDMVPLTGLNRTFVAQGLKVMAQRRNPGLAALCDVAGVNRPPDAALLGFRLGPRINAGGRVGESGLGVRLLTMDDPAKAVRLAKQLDDHNQERQQIEEVCLLEAIEQAEDSGLFEHLVYVAAEDWHPGVLGIVASRLKERYNRPACVVAFADGEGSGSGRSVHGIDLGAAVITARQNGLLLRGGGHKMAAGFGLRQEQNEAFRNWLALRMDQQAKGRDMTPRLWLDGILSPSGVTLDLLHSLEQLAPFGMGNPSPCFMLSRVVITWSKLAGTDHVRCSLRREGDGKETTTLSAIAFRCAGQPLGDLLLNSHNGQPVHLAGRIQINAWQGRETAQFLIEDAALG